MFYRISPAAASAGLTLNGKGGGGGKNAPPLVFFFKYLQNKKKYDFALLWHSVITYFERFCQISCEKFDCLTSFCDFVRAVPKIQKQISFQK